MKCVLASMRPRWCENVAIRRKTDEIRKNSPNLQTPFKCYIYQTRMMWGYPILRALRLFDLAEKLEKGKGKVIGEFVCDKIEQVDVNNIERLVKTSLVSTDEMWKYARPKSMFDLKAWHISDLKIYDKPKPLSEFHSFNCSVYWEDGYPMPTHEMKRAPQSWCYVEELQDG